MSGTTPDGWPYVTPDDHPKEYPTLSQQLAEKLDTQGDWAPWPAAWTQGIALTASQQARFTRIGNTIIGNFIATLTPAGTAGQPLEFTPPAPPLGGWGSFVIGYALITGSSSVPCLIWHDSPTGRARFLSMATAAPITTAHAGTVARGGFTYEAV